MAGTRDGITAVQLDVKLAGGVPLEILCEGEWRPYAEHAVRSCMLERERASS